MKQLLRDSTENKNLKRTGFARFPCLSREETTELLSFYEEHTNADHLKGFHATMFNTDRGYRSMMDEKIREALNFKFDQFFHGEFELLYANFMVKEPGRESEMKIHQDWAYVDEQQENSYAIWIPLMDLTPSNGALQVYPGSHFENNYVRGPGVTCPFFDQWDHVRNKYMVPLYLKTGEAVVWNHRLAHYSPPNLTSTARIAVTAIIVPKGKQIYHFYKDGPNADVERYLVGRDFYMNYSIGVRPLATLDRTVSEHTRPLTQMELETLFAKSGYVMEQSKDKAIRYPSRKVFHSEALENEFNSVGFIVTDLLSKEQFKGLMDLLDALNHTADKENVTTESEYELSFFNRDAEYRKRVVKEIYDYLKPLLDPVLDNYEPLIVNLFNKKPGSGEIPIHQNWTFVDEEQFTSVSVWIPLCDVGHENGTLEVVPKTHNTLTNYRSPSIPWVFEGLEEALKERYLQPLELVRGQAAILDDAILHWSSENNSTQDRKTIQLIMKPKEAIPLHYYCEDLEKGELSVYEVDSDFFSSFQMNERPEGVPIVAKEHFTYKSIDEEELTELIT